jgi:hypothetical protein
VNGETPRPSRYCAVRSRIFFWVLSAPLVILYLAFSISVAADSSIATILKLVGFVPVVYFLGVAIRMMFGWDLVIHQDHLVYRAAFRNYQIPRNAIDRVVVEDGKSSVGLNNLLVVNLYLLDSSKRTLKLFNCFRPTAERPIPIWISADDGLSRAANRLARECRHSAVVDLISTPGRILGECPGTPARGHADATCSDLALGPWLQAPDQPTRTTKAPLGSDCLV